LSKKYLKPVSGNARRDHAVPCPALIEPAAAAGGRLPTENYPELVARAKLIGGVWRQTDLDGRLLH
jgi:hypothetical protein